MIENTKEVPIIQTDVMLVQVEKAVITRDHGDMQQEILVHDPIVQQKEVTLEKEIVGERQVAKEITKDVVIHNREPFEVYGEKEVPLWRGTETIEKIKEVSVTKTEIVEVPKYTEVRVVEEKPIVIEKIKPVECHIEKPIITEVERIV